ncbi:Hypothetical predicted protein [Octopus vulgaris]|uniref:Uncharacterized protein n=1 Tax=Octopus vulgaris TaxID=6645 RepID=A0AA36ARE9_OCTVU|nr:Hypothetical predicted protein [Octopus vulgaris]
MPTRLRSRVVKLVNVKLSEDNFDVGDKGILMPCEKYYKFEKEIAEISYDVKSFLLPEIPSSETEVEELEKLETRFCCCY